VVGDPGPAASVAHVSHLLLGRPAIIALGAAGFVEDGSTCFFAQWESDDCTGTMFVGGSSQGAEGQLLTPLATFHAGSFFVPSQIDIPRVSNSLVEDHHSSTDCVPSVPNGNVVRFIPPDLCCSASRVVWVTSTT
jgi:hypothetical protein